MTIANRMVQTELTNLQMHLLEHSFEYLTNDTLHFSMLLRKFLLRSHPEFVELLEPLSTPQFQFMSISSLTLLIHSLQNPEHMRVISKLIHDQEYSSREQRELYDAFYDALMNVLAEVIEDAWSPAFQGAWKAAMDLTKSRIFQDLERPPATSLIQNSPFSFATRQIHTTALLVDDNEQVRKTLCVYLENLGFDCFEAENGGVALHFLDGNINIDVVITDNHMPIMTGLQLLKTLSQKPKQQRPPCILCSGNLSKDLVEDALDLGAWAIIAKPYSYEELYTSIEQAIQSKTLLNTHRSTGEDQ